MASIAVLDVETTGLNPFRNDRIVELALVVVDSDGSIVREFATLINPERDIGPTRVHGLSTRDVLSAPTFSGIARELADVLYGCVAIAGHNVRFDLSFLDAEFKRIGFTLPDFPSICTMKLAGGGTLARNCEEYGIEFIGDSHEALNDARATAHLLKLLLEDAPHLRSEIERFPPMMLPVIPFESGRPVTRSESRRQGANPPGYIQRLLQRAPSELSDDQDGSALLAYSALLERVLQDRLVDASEGEALFDLATRWNISASQIQQAHRDFLLRLAVVALADGIVTDGERRDLHTVSQLLGIDTRNLDALLEVTGEKLKGFQPSAPVAPASLPAEGITGRRVCFTGECACQYEGSSITRSVATQLASERGLIVQESVTKGLDILVVADPESQSGKARKARQYGITILPELVFWRKIGVAIK